MCVTLASAVCRSHDLDRVEPVPGRATEGVRNRAHGAPGDTPTQARPCRRATAVVGQLRRLAILAAATATALALAAATPEVKRLSLPGARGLVMLDYLAHDAARGVVWLPAGNLGTLLAVDTRTDAISVIEGFATGDVDVLGKRRTLGPSSVAIGDGVVYVGNRGDASLCVVDAERRSLLGCQALAPSGAGLSASPDAVVAVRATRELWITSGAPPLGVAAQGGALRVMDVSDPRHPKPRGSVALGGSAEGYAVDERAGRFYTNLEERRETVAIDVRHRRIVARWHPGCETPSGVALDAERGFIFVACEDRVVALDARKPGHVLGTFATGTGLDNIDYAPSVRRLYAAASGPGTLAIANVGDAGRMTRLATVATAKGARSVIAGPAATAYVIDPYGGALIKVGLTR
jgi:hypothetical protein